MILRRSQPVTVLIAVTGLFVMPISTARAAEELGGNSEPGVCLLWKRI